MGRKKKKFKPIIFCYYCDRTFENEKVLIQHQRAKHFKCIVCHKRLGSAHGMMVHVFQVHKQQIDKVPHAKEGRDSFQVDIFGMSNIPQDVIDEKHAERGEPPSKRARIDNQQNPLIVENVSVPTQQPINPMMNQMMNPMLNPMMNPMMMNMNPMNAMNPMFNPMMFHMNGMHKPNMPMPPYGSLPRHPHPNANLRPNIPMHPMQRQMMQPQIIPQHQPPPYIQTQQQPQINVPHPLQPHHPHPLTNHIPHQQIPQQNILNMRQPTMNNPYLPSPHQQQQQQINQTIPTMPPPPHNNINNANKIIPNGNQQTQNNETGGGDNTIIQKKNKKHHLVYDDELVSMEEKRFLNPKYFWSEDKNHDNQPTENEDIDLNQANKDIDMKSQ